MHLREALRIRERALGESSPLLAETSERLAAVLRSLGPSATQAHGWEDLAAFATISS